jgi:arabinose-5-phosphate isomerase
VEREVCPLNLAPTTSTTATVALGDALAVALVQARDFQPSDFARFHPGGALGRRLLVKVRDAMHRNFPIVDPQCPFHDCLLAMTEGRLGAVLVMNGDNLSGIVTDGDIRRAVLKHGDVQALLAAEFMTATPVVVPEDMPLHEAETIMVQRKIKMLVVADSHTAKPSGILEIFNQESHSLL